MDNRLHKNEQLDNFELSGQILHQTLAELAIINRYFGNYRAVKKVVLSAIKKTNNQPIRIIDIGCGGGDLLLYLAKIFRKKGINASFLGIDGNAHSLQYGKEKSVDFPEIGFLQADLLSDDFQLPMCDILISTHFLYHFNNQEVTKFLARQKPFIQNVFIASELERNRLAYWLFFVFSPLLGFSKLTREDGLLAIQRAFKKSELKNILSGENLANVSIKRQFFFRLILTMKFTFQNQNHHV